MTLFRYLVCMLVLVSLAYKANSQAYDTLRKWPVHYKSPNVSAPIYLSQGSKVFYSYEPSLGSVDFSIVYQAQSSKFATAEKKVATKQSETWQYMYEVEESGCYALKYQPEGQINYLGGLASIVVSTSNGKSNALTCARSAQATDSVRQGYERLIGFSELGSLKRGHFSYHVNKEISSGGKEYCEAKVKLRAGQKVLVTINAKDSDPHISYNIYKVDRERHMVSMVYSDTQKALENCAFESLTGGEYIIQFSGRSIFERTHDLVIQELK